MNYSETIRTIQDDYCRKCRAGQALMALVELQKEQPEEVDQPPATTAPVVHRPQKATTKPSRPAAPAAAAPAGKKTCNKCGQTKPIELFERNKQCKDGHVGICKACRYAAARSRTTIKHDPAPVKAAKIERPRPHLTKRAQAQHSHAPLPSMRGVELKFECKACHAKFMTQEQLDAHNDARHDGQASGPHACEVCGKEFANLGDLSDHIEAVHGEY